MGIYIHKEMVVAATCNNKAVRSGGVVVAATCSSKARGVAVEKHKCRACRLLLQM